MNNTLVIGDLHFDEKRIKAIDTATNSIFSIIGASYDKIILLGDIFNEYPTAKERLIFAEFLQRLRLKSNNIMVIEGTDTHDWTKGIYNLEDLKTFGIIHSEKEYIDGKYLYGHFETEGATYSNGFKATAKREIDKKLEYVLGHIHRPDDSNNIHYLGSVYKTDFSEKDEQKRIAIITDKGIEYKNIESFPMYELNLTGENGKVTISGKIGKEIKDCDLKIVAETDSISLPEIHRIIKKIKDKFNIEYYQQTIKVKEIKVNVPAGLKEEALLEKYCITKKVNFELIKKGVNMSKVICDRCPCLQYDDDGDAACNLGSVISYMGSIEDVECCYSSFVSNSCKLIEIKCEDSVFIPQKRE